MNVVTVQQNRTTGKSLPSNSDTKYASAASCSASTAELWKRKSAGQSSSIQTILSLLAIKPNFAIFAQYLS